MRVFRVLKIMVMIAAFVFVFGFVTEHLWNWLVPSITGWHTITYWQAVGLLLLCKILFGGFHKHGYRRGGDRWREKREWKRRMKERWEHMTPDERESFRAAMKQRWGHCGKFGKESAEAQGAEGR